MPVLIHTKVVSWSFQGVSDTEQQDNRAPGDIPTVPESLVSHHGTAVQLELHVICMSKKKKTPHSFPSLSGSFINKLMSPSLWGHKLADFIAVLEALAGLWHILEALLGLSEFSKIHSYGIGNKPLFPPIQLHRKQVYIPLSIKENAQSLSKATAVANLHLSLKDMFSQGLGELARMVACARLGYKQDWVFLLPKVKAGCIRTPITTDIGEEWLSINKNIERHTKKSINW